MDMKKYFSSKEIKGRCQSVIAPETAKALTLFCEQEPEFTQAVEQSGKTFQDCLDAVCEKAGMSLSDFEAYSRAVKFYFPTASLHFNMRIDLCGNAEADKHEPPITMNTQSKNSLSVSLDELLDF